MIAQPFHTAILRAQRVDARPGCLLHPYSPRNARQEVMRFSILSFICLVGSAAAFVPQFGAAGASVSRQRGALSMVNVGDVAPDFSLKDQNGKMVKLSQFKGKNDVVLYFYPAEANAFNANLDQFLKKKAVVLGISKDENHQPFVQKYGLKMSLLSDVGDAVRKQYKVPTSLFGALAGRVTYIIGKDGKVKKIYDNQFAPETHIPEALAALS